MKQANGKGDLSEPLPAFSEDGVDLTLIRWMLSLTPDERLQQLENHAALAEELRHANPTIPVPHHMAVPPILRQTLMERRRQPRDAQER